MTEAEWLTSEDPAAMLEWVTDARASSGTGTRVNPPIPDDRKLRLFACALCRQVWGWSGVDQLGTKARHCVEVAERNADGEASWREMDAAFYGLAPGGTPTPNALYGVVPLSFTGAGEAAGASANNLRLAGQAPAAQAALLREVAGNPFRPPRRLTFGELTNTVLAIARECYDARDWTGLPVLADALEEAGCPDGDLLRHLRGYERCGCLDTLDALRKGCTCHGFGKRELRGPHARGCWALDLVLGKE